MIIIQTKNKKQNYIAGIFKRAYTAEKEFKKIPNKSFFFKTPLPGYKFPFYIIESENGFTFHQNKKEVNAEIRKAREHFKSNPLKEGEDIHDREYFAYYTITEEYKPPSPGVDYMGSLDHDHVTAADF